MDAETGARGNAAEEPPGEGEGLSTGAKLALGCGGLVFVTFAAVAVLLGVGWQWVTDQVEDVGRTVEERVEGQKRANETLERLEREHPFDPPADATVGADRARRFFRATNAAWEELEGWAGELTDLERRLDGRDPGLSEVGNALRGLDKLSESREVLARALEEQEMPLEEYLWTGFALTRALDAMEGGTDRPRLTEETRRLIREHRATLEELDGDGDDGIGKEIVFRLAWMWGSLEPGDLGELGLDTLEL